MGYARLDRVIIEDDSFFAGRTGVVVDVMRTNFGREFVDLIVVGVSWSEDYRGVPTITRATLDQVKVRKRASDVRRP